MEQTYDKDLKNTPKKCISIKIDPFSIKVDKLTKQFFKSTKNCSWKLKIRYKTNITCNSIYNIKQHSTSGKNGFIEFSLYHNKKLIYLLYEDIDSKKFDSSFEELSNYIHHVLLL